jgi:peptidoglycan/LPS O-acetylase OafA/YrhL
MTPSHPAASVSGSTAGQTGAKPIPAGSSVDAGTAGDKSLKDRSRLDHLDGLRGTAAVVVVAFHVMSALTPWLVKGLQSDAAWIAYSPVAVFWNGAFAVSVFFVLSGFVVTNATLRKSDPLWIDVVIRYLRLSVPATLSTLFAWFLLNLFPGEANKLHDLTRSRWLEWTFQDQIPGAANAVYSGLIDVFLNGGSYFNNALLTMRPEFIGSLMCFVLCAIKRANLRLGLAVLLSVLILFSRKMEYECFIVGISLREAWAAGRLPSRFPILALLVGLVVGAQGPDASRALGAAWVPDYLAVGTKNSLWPAIAAGLVVYGCMNATTLIRVLSSRAGKFLGSISFPMYLIHVPIINTAFALSYRGVYGNSLGVAFVIVGFAFLLLFCSAVAEMFVERPFLQMLGRLRRRLKAPDVRAW